MVSADLSSPFLGKTAPHLPISMGTGRPTNLNWRRFVSVSYLPDADNGNNIAVKRL
jgi:hypothetical protein